MKRPRPTDPTHRRGTVAVLVGICLVPLLGLMALVLDGGLLLAQRRHAQATADTASMAAANVLYTNYATNQGYDYNNAASKAALAIAAGNGYTNDGVGSKVTVNIPPLAGPSKGKAGYAEVIVQSYQSRYFSALWGSGTNTVAGRSVARGLAKGSDIGLLLTNPSGNGALSGSGNGSLTVTKGSLTVDSTSSQAISLSGNASVTASNINIVGGYSAGKGGLHGTIKTGVTPVPDPYANLPVPDPTKMTVQSSSKLSYSGGAYTLQPGVYQGGISLSGQATVTLQPGTYYLQGGGLSLSGQASLAGTGVTIYNAPQGSGDQIDLSGKGSVTLTPPTSGNYAGFSIIQDPSSTAGMSITGNGLLAITGAIDAPKASLSLTGNGSTDTFGSQIIASSINMTGNGTVTIGGTTGTPAGLRDLRIVE